VTRIVEAGITRVVAAVEDPNPVVQGRGFAYLKAHGVAVQVGEAAETAVALNEPFFTLMHERRPFVILKAAISFDGHIAAAPGQRTPLTSAAANRHAHRVRAEVDAIAVGVGTILADDPALTARGAYRQRPLVRVVFDRSLRTPPQARIFSTRDAGPVIIIASAAAAGRKDIRQALEARGAEIEVVDGTLRSALQRLGERQVGSLLLEGGAAIHAAAWDDHLVDYVRLYVTPHALGDGGLTLLAGRAFSSAELRDRHAFALGPDTVIEGYVHRAR
jgi:diaminohydroxyphosphoribosylaminopyrimidine deaminase/5-amino-6-(5-phosphoribosylamino)uracil reductase